ncbi:ubiquitin carboxyl-terminal hydrolase 37-like isoform x2 [Nannochloropsis oceanica]
MDTKARLREVHIQVFQGSKSKGSQRDISFDGEKIRCGGAIIKVKALQKCDEENRMVCFASGGHRFNIFVPASPRKALDTRHFLAQVKGAYDALQRGCRGDGRGAAAGFTPVDRIRGVGSPTLSEFAQPWGGNGSARRGGRSLFHSTQRPKLYLARSSSAASGSLPFAGCSAASPNFSIGTTDSIKDKRILSSSITASSSIIIKRPLSVVSMSTTSAGVKKKKRFSMLDQVLGSGIADAGGKEIDDDDLLYESNRLFSSSPEKIAKGRSNSSASSFLLRDGSSRIYSTKPPLGAPSSSSSPFQASSSKGWKREGLLNLGNTCYLNSVVQALAAAGEFVNDLLSNFWLRYTLQDLRESVCVPRHLKVYGSFAGLLLVLRQKTALSKYSSINSSTGTDSSSSRKCVRGGVMDPSLFRREISSYFAAYGEGRQQDAHEFMGDLLNSLQQELCLYGRRFAALKIQADKEARAARAKANCLMEGGKGMDDEKEERTLNNKPVAVGKGNRGSAGDAGGGKGRQTLLRTFFRSRSLSLTTEPSSLTPTSSGHLGGKKEGLILPESFKEDTLISQEEAAILEQVLPVTRHFHAQVKKTLTCVGADCAYSRSYIESFTDFSVDLVGPGEEGGGAGPNGEGGGVPLQVLDLLAHSFREQELELTCEHCQRQNKVRATHRFRKLPNLLVVHLKRFRFTGALDLLGASSSKLQTRVMAPPSLDLAQFCDARTVSPPDVRTGLEGTAGPQLTKALLKSLERISQPPTPATRFGTNFYASSTAVGANEDDEQGTNSASLSKILQEGGGSAVQLLKLQQQCKQAATQDRKNRKNQGENRWPLDQENKDPTRSPPAEGLTISSSPSGSTLVDLVEGSSSFGSSQEGVNNKELQEAIRLSLIESRGCNQDKVEGKNLEDVRVLQKGWRRSTRFGANKSSIKPKVMIDASEDKENRSPPSTKRKILPLLPLDLRNLTTRPLSPSFCSFLSSPSGSMTEAPLAAVRAGELQSAYTLLSVVRHLGRSANSGHYIADVRRAGSTPSSPALWIRYDDALVSALPQGDRILEDDASLQTGYIFIYRACT